MASPVLTLMPSPVVVVVVNVLRAPGMTPSAHSFDSTSSHCAWLMLPPSCGPANTVKLLSLRVSLLRRLEPRQFLLYRFQRSLSGVKQADDLARARVADARRHEFLVIAIELDMQLPDFVGNGRAVNPHVHDIAEVVVAPELQR